MKFKVIFGAVLALNFFVVCAQGCYIYEPFFSPPQYIEYDSEPRVHPFQVILRYYYPKGSFGKENQDFSDYIHQLKVLLEQKGLDGSMVDTLKEVYYKGQLPSNSYETALRFLDVAFHDDRVIGGWKELTRLRHEILIMFISQKSQEILEEIQRLNPAEVGGYGKYLEGAYFFYSRDYEKALKAFQALQTSAKFPSPLNYVLSFFRKKTLPSWLEETALYMEARINLILSQRELSGYESAEQLREKVDKDQLKRSRELFDKYLHQYPQGRYVESVKNLSRKFDYLQGKQAHLDQTLRDLLNRTLENPKNSDEVHQVFNEFLMYFKGKPYFESDSPLLLAYFVQSRKMEESWLSQLERQKSRFAPYPGLFQYLKALMLFRENQFQTLVESIPEEQNLSKDDLLGITVEVLRAKAFIKLERLKEALAVLQKLKPMNDDQIDLLILETHMSLQSPTEQIVKDLYSGRVLETFLEGSVTEAELEDLSKSKCLFKMTLQPVNNELLRRYLVTGHLKKVIAHKSFQDKKFDEIRPYVQKLLEDPQDNKSLLEVGKWLMEGPIHPSSAPVELEMVLPGHVLRMTYDPPVNYFVQIVKNHRASGQTSMIEAEALHHLIKTCFRGYGPSYSCQWIPWQKDLVDSSFVKWSEETHKKEVPKWFRRLHTTYKGNPWAKMTSYYY